MSDVVIALALMSLGFFYLALNLKGDRHAPLQILFTVLGLFISMVNLEAITANAATDSLGIANSIVSAYGITMYATIFFIFYIILFFIWEALSKMGKKPW